MLWCFRSVCSYALVKLVANSSFWLSNEKRRAFAVNSSPLLVSERLQHTEEAKVDLRWPCASCHQVSLHFLRVAVVCQRDLGPYSEVYHEFSGHVSLDCTNLDIAIHVILYNSKGTTSQYVKELDHTFRGINEF